MQVLFSTFLKFELLNPELQSNIEAMPRGFGFRFFTPHLGLISPSRQPSHPWVPLTCPLQGAVTSRKKGPRRGSGGAAPGPKLGARVGLPMPPSRTPGSRAQCRPPRRPRGRRFGAPPGHQRAGRGRGAGTKGERESNKSRGCCSDSGHRDRQASARMPIVTPLPPHSGPSGPNMA